MNFFVIDPGGLYVELANKLSDGGKHKVYYWTSWTGAFPSFTDYAPGLNFEHLQKEKWLYKIEEADCIFFPDVHSGDLAYFIKKLFPKKSVFSSGKGEILEAKRLGLKTILEQLKLPVQHYEKITGITKLKEYIKKSPDKFIKTDIFRSEDRGMNSFRAKSFNESEEIFRDINYAFGPFSDTIDFCVEDCIKSDVEIGVDGFYSAGVGYGENILIGYEYNKACYIGKVILYKDMPVALKETMDKFKPVLDRLDYRGAISTEELIVDKVKHYFLDICSRFLSPSDVMYTLSDNFPEMVNNIGLKKPFKIGIPYKYVACAPIEASHAEKHYVKLIVDPKDRKNVKFKTVGCVGKDYYGIPGHSTVAVALGYGNTVDEAINMATKYSEKVSGYSVSNLACRDFMNIKEEIEKGKKLGLDF